VLFFLPVCSKPKANPQLVAQQVTAQLQQLLPPTLPRKDKHPAKRTVGERERGGGGDTTAGETDTSLDSTDTLHRTPTSVPHEPTATATLSIPLDQKRK